MSLANKVGIGFLVLVALMAALSWSQLALIDRLHAESRKLSELSFEAAGLNLRLQGDVARLRELSLKSVVLRDPAYAAEVDRLRREIKVDLERLASFDRTDGERQEVERLAAVWQTYEAAAERRSDETRTGHRARLNERFDAVDRQLRRLAAAARSAMAGRVAESGARVEQARWVAWAGTFAGLLAAAVISLAIVRSLARSLRRLGHGTRAVAGGDFDHRVPLEGGPELAALAEDFNAMARQLSQLDRLKKDFLANVSHDLKTPLASIQEATRLLLEGIPGPLSDRQRRLLSLNLKSGERLFRLIEDLLHLSRLEAGTMEYSPRRQDLVELAHAALEEIGGLIGGDQLAVVKDFPAEPVTVACDGSAVLKVLQNLLSNAAKYTPGGGLIGIRLRQVGSRAELPAAVRERWPGERYLPAAEIEIWDTGPGVPDKDKERIFERFYRADAGGGGPQGTGLGLAIAREIVAGHSGELWVEDGPDKGSVFRVVLWSQPPADTSSGAADSELAPAAGRARRPSRAAVGLLAVALLAACHGRAPVVPPGPLELGDAAFERSDYHAASVAYQEYLDHGAPSSAADRVVFRLALIHLLPGNPASDPRRSRELLWDLVERFPESPYRAVAEYLLGLQREVEVLRRQLEEIKRIDLEPGPPPGS